MRRILSIVFALILIGITPCFADVPKLPNPSAFLEAADDAYLNKVDDSPIGNGLAGILAVLYKVGYPLAVGIFLIIAIQLIIAPPQKKGEAKAALTPFFIGLLLLVAGVHIAVLIIGSFTTLFGGS